MGNVRAATCALICVSALACSQSHERATPPRKPLILDQVHNNGPKGFFWLPPMVAQPTLEGSNDTSLSPTIQIDEIDLSNPPNATVTTIATFTRTTGTNG